MKPALFTLFNENVVQQKIEISEGEELIVGRKGSLADIEIDDSSVSRQHARLSFTPDGIFIIDTSSTNGTYVNNNFLTAGVLYKLSGDDCITFGNAKNWKLKLTSWHEVYSERVTLDESKTLFEWFELKKSFLIGRSSEADIKVDDPTVSRKHARLYQEGTEFWIEDLQSTNGTFLNGERIFGKVKLKETDTIYVGLHQFKFNEKPKDLNKEPAIQAINVEKVYGVNAKGEKLGLQLLSFEVPKQEFVALMGPSGCGKSTLLKALNGDNPATSGRVLIHGLELEANYNFLKRKIGYVPQDDIVHKELSVEKSLYYAAKLRMGDGVSEDVIAQKINEVLDSLNINRPDIRTKKVGSLSGGQRKRVSIAVELLNSPSILFLDEPTSPLDPETIEEFLKCIKSLTEKGTTVIMVTHKPEDLNYVDKVIFLTTKGYHAYYGDKGEKVLNYFSAKDIIGIYALLSKDDKVKYWYEKWNQNSEKQIVTNEKPKPFEKPKSESFFGQLYWLCRRYMNIKLNDRINTVLLFAQPVVIAGLVALIFNDLDLGILFLMAISAIWFGVSNACKEIVGEIPIYRRERMFNMRIGTYMLSKIIVLTFFAALQALVFVSIIYLRFKNDTTPGLDNPVMLGYFWQNALFMLYLAFSATLMGLLISAIFDNTEKVMTIVPIALMPQIMLAGVVTKLNDQITEFLSYTMIGRWGTEGFAILQDQSVGADTTGSIVNKIPEMVTDTLINPQNHVVTLVPHQTGEMIASKSGAMETLDLYHDGLLNWTQSSDMQYVWMVITIINLLSFVGVYIALKRKDTI
jgi:ABC-type multidrug transport system ATPase subunit/pSer/pThr/pTyr-binding forkhead associated (FHA) protein